MTTNHLQLLTDMGITVWKQRVVSDVIYPFWIVCGRELSIDKKQLIEKLANALKWSREQYSLIICSAKETPSDWQQKIKTKKPQQILLCGCDLAMQLGLPKEPTIVDSLVDDHKYKIAIIDSLDKLVLDPQAKRNAWQVMKSLLVHT